MSMRFPKLPSKAAYLWLNNHARRNTLSLEVLEDLRSQLLNHLTSPHTGRVLRLPPFKPSILRDLENASNRLAQGSHHESEYSWLVDADAWEKERATLPNVLVLRSVGHAFSLGYDLIQLASLSQAEVNRTFDLCAEVMSLIRLSPVPVVCPIQRHAVGPGLQLALSTDYPIALSTTTFQLAGTNIGLPSTSSATAVSRVLSPGQTYRMLLGAQPVTADEMRGAVDVVQEPEHAESTDTAAAAFGARVAKVVQRLANSPGQPTALCKWAYWTQIGIRGVDEDGRGGDGYVDAVDWAARVMALHAKSAYAKEGLAANHERRRPQWKGFRPVTPRS